MRKIKKVVCFAVILFFVTTIFALSSAAARVIPGGDAVAVRLQSDGVIVLGFTDDAKDNPARRAGLKRGDRIVSLGENEIRSSEDLSAALALAEEETVLRYLRGNKEHRTAITVKKSSNGSACLGVLIKDCTAGIGTLTFVLPDCGRYGCLGHGITDPDTETLFPIGRGDLYPARITSVRKGAAGAPGELQGMFCSPSVGTADKNVQEGLFGGLDPSLFTQREWVETAEKSEVREGAATIRCTLDDGCIGEYAVEIVRVYRILGGTSKNMLLRVTDEALLAKTGGIVQGMSGSPIFQNGKLIGAVTHVLVNTPDTGYGIFIENMLGAAG